MRRAILKGTGLWVIGNLPKGVNAYQYLTRNIMGTQGSHILKLYRMWPEIVSKFAKFSDRELNYSNVWVHEFGWTPFVGFANYLICGKGGLLTNTSLTGAKVLERHITDSINRVLELATKLKEIVPIPDERIQKLNTLRWVRPVEKIFESIEAVYKYGISPGKLPSADDSIDFLYCGGQLEHYHPENIHLWLLEAFRVMKPGGLIILALDHRDHLYHFDKKWPFGYHYSLSDTNYKLTHSNPLLYHNRLLPGEVSALIENAGFEKVKIYRRVLPANQWIDDGSKLVGDFGIERSRLSERFRNISDDDLKTAAAQYIYKKSIK